MRSSVPKLLSTASASCCRASTVANVADLERAINRLGRAGKSVEAATVFNDAVRNNLAPSVECYSGLVQAVVRSGRPEDCRIYLARMKVENLQPSLAIFKTLIKHYQELRNGRACSYWLRELLNSNLNPDLYAVTWTIDACAKDRNNDCFLEGVRWLLRCYQQKSNFKVSLNNVAWNCILHRCAKKGDSSSAKYWFRRMQNFGISQNLISFNSLLDSYSKVGDVVNSVKVFEQLEQSNIKPDVFSYNSLIAGFSRVSQNSNASSAVKYFDKLIEAGLQPTDVTFNSIVAAFMRCGDLENANLWRQKMASFGLRADRISFQTGLQFSHLKEAGPRHKLLEHDVAS